MRRILSVLLFLLASPALAAEYYFSDCAGPGGAGTIGDPWCEIPTGETIQKSVALLSDGAGTEFVAGDTAYVCAGACDGSGSGTINVVSTVSTTWLRPRMSGSAGSPITIQPYCSGSNCETVTISGDGDGDGVGDAAEPERWMDDGSGAQHHWTLEGDPAATGNRYLRFTSVRGANGLWDFSGGGFYDWTWHRLEIDRDHSSIWAGGSVGLNCSGVPYVFYFDQIAAGTMSITFNLIHHICGFVTRFNSNYTAASTINFDDNEVYNANTVTVNNQFGSGQDTPSDCRQNYRRNLIRDSGPMSFHVQYQHLLIEDNTIECRGEYWPNSNTNLGCPKAIEINDGTTPSCNTTCVGGSNPGTICGGVPGNCTGGGSCTGDPDCWGDDIVIRRNLIFGRGNKLCVGGANAGLACTVGGDCPSSTCLEVAQTTGIVWSASHLERVSGDAAYTNAVIENNTIWHQLPIFTGVDQVCDGNPTNVGRAAITVIGNSTGLKIQNNTVVDAMYPTIFCKQPNDSREPIFEILSNIFVRSSHGSGVASLLIYDAGADGSLVHNNNANAAGAAVNVAKVDTTAYDCASIDSFNNGTTRTGNKCATDNFINISGGKETWDLHLQPSDTVDKDTGIAAATEDRDQQTRDANPDIGSDELVLGGKLAIGGKVVIGGKVAL